MLILFILPFWSSFLIRVYAWMIILSPRGYIMRAINGVMAWSGLDAVQVLFTPAAVIVVLVYVHLPFMVLPLYENLEKHDPLLRDAAKDLGAITWQCFWRITWPLSLPGVWAGAALVFTPCLGMFAVPELVGGTRSILIGNLIKQQFLDSRHWPLGSALSLARVGSVLALAGLGSLAARVGRAARPGLLSPAQAKASADGSAQLPVARAGRDRQDDDTPPKLDCLVRQRHGRHRRFSQQRADWQDMRCRARTLRSGPHALRRGCNQETTA